MRLVGYRTAAGSAIGRLDGESGLVPLGGAEQFWADPAQAVLRPTGTALDITRLTLVPSVPPTARVLCVGLNYADHVAEGTFQRPTHPAVFGRWTRSLTVSETPAPVPAGEQGLDWEGELAAVIGRETKDVSADDALDAVFGYAVFNDLTARNAQHRTTQWTVGKNADRSGPMSGIVTADEVGDPGAGLRIVTRVNGAVVQDGSTADMIFSVGEIVSYLSRAMTLYPGDLIVTGTPQGVGYARRPPRFLHAGDEVTVEIERVGCIRTPVVAAAEAVMTTRPPRATAPRAA
ncbi:fumarylacetoacetate hydrolase family protein [Kitasatospora sp. NBC_00240]|uniref:fumarylacetoacetate hydrolase family protein n=1 Tax=Kitasatospora sp. NBC_00240 TaxID=2903567 RepID=UPI00224F50C0|nr:fumarylacetoacetate hydrolase family protein [Kitasatospora sp. NBC_00240]MCX5214747.1 fumarylacetoacetate hydrolase family protein [Kitasatospora sp. NBC_00240]